MKRLNTLTIAVCLLLTGFSVVESKVPQSSSRFVDADTFEMLTYGKAADSAKGMRAEVMACSAARNMALAHALEELGNAGAKSAKIDQAEITTDSARQTAIKEISGSVKNLQIIDSKYDKNTKICTATSRIKEKGLRDKVIGALKKK